MTNQSILAVAVARGAMLLAFWLTLAHWTIVDVAIGVLAAGIGSWVSVVLLPPAPHAHRSFLRMAQFAVRFVIQSFLAGWDIARRALDPKMPLLPGLTSCPVRLRAGVPRSAFRALMSLQPGSLPVEERADGTLLVHCLNMDQPVSQSYLREERLFADAFGIETEND